MPKDTRVEQVAWLHLLLVTSTIPSKACFAHISAFFPPAKPKVGCLEQSGWPHLGRTFALTIPLRACSKHISRVVVPVLPKDGCLEQLGWAHFFCLTSTIPSKACSAHLLMSLWLAAAVVVVVPVSFKELHNKSTCIETDRNRETTVQTVQQNQPPS